MMEVMTTRVKTTVQDVYKWCHCVVFFAETISDFVQHMKSCDIIYKKVTLFQIHIA